MIHTKQSKSFEMSEKEFIDQLKNRVLDGGELTDDEVYQLAEIKDTDALRKAAGEITRALCKPNFDSCSIVNARSGRCSENCKWCAQSAHFKTGCETYDMVDENTCMEAARRNAENGVMRFSLVASGRAVKGKALEKVCRMLKRAKEETGIHTCASLGLLNEEELLQLKASGATRYHCNIETAPSYFKTLCTTHTMEDKFRTIETARRIGFGVCSGGIIGMGETRRQRAEFALALRRAQPISIPINILQPIPGTPLENIELISFDEILDAIAIMRFTHPRSELRFAGGRARFTEDEQLQMMNVGINAGVVGTLLTTIASSYEADKELVERAGLKF